MADEIERPFRYTDTEIDTMFPSDNLKDVYEKVKAILVDLAVYHAQVGKVDMHRIVVDHGNILDLCLSVENQAAMKKMFNHMDEDIKNRPVANQALRG